MCTQISNIDVLDTKDKIPLACIDVYRGWEDVLYYRQNTKH